MSRLNGTRITREKQTIRLMINLFCRKQHHPASDRCADCEDLLDYALNRLDNCPFGEKKPACSKCAVHCYQPAYRERIKAVMRFSGPRMLVYHPVYLIFHTLDTLRSRSQP